MVTAPKLNLTFKQLFRFPPFLSNLSFTWQGWKMYLFLLLLHLFSLNMLFVGAILNLHFYLHVIFLAIVSFLTPNTRHI